MRTRTLIHPYGQVTNLANLPIGIFLEGVKKTKVHRGNPHRHMGKHAKTSHRL